MIGCGPEEYVFSDGWKPGPSQNGGEKFSRWWKRHVKDGLGIDADPYDLKRLHTTEMASQNEQIAADFNSHANTRMNEKHYDQMSEKRKLETQKRQNLKF
ncbi:MAG: hypothetical protein EOP52_00840 [Sphingobacteriales bacterium]|nr:MAG: hypothetical protein EOP52_00840 [Sphingobacteriales bacterium]